MDNSQEIRWRQFFENFEKIYLLLEEYSDDLLENELEIAGYIHYFEMALEHAGKVNYAYLEAKEIAAETPRQTIKEMAQLDIIHDERIWFKAQNRKNLAFYIHNDELANELVGDIDHTYLPELEKFYHNLKELL
ncbi:HI0074 family nucleotidyltransferase substrate-binding subunit [Aquisalibacillus elongatus]|uniref:Nucleotidyltransferase substrate binding protein (TIGR01987 family) n=1 Tax=Aquisalibacillus elongatus TaxID=485577 RepID=A0A3N5C255_9BACI|nr:HI0074 family nucleotidyltransferase substrate-binding subunit [Aquisalibacillus elongatus]RPF53442.1 nucleotidyltransferase substrate binding protein (TIGR01987 family) [Aquisalibacillus elongatus]